MANFNFDQQLTDALKLDSTLYLNNSISRFSLKPNPRGNLSGIGLNRSRSASRVSPSLLSTKPKQFSRSKSPARSKTPTRIGVNEVYKRAQNGADRFIPNRSTTDMEFASHSLATSEEDTDSLSSTQLERRRNLEENLNLNNQGGDSRILSFTARAPAAKDGYQNNIKILYSAGKPSAPKASNTRQVSATAEKILDAPDMMNDFYLHLIDWSSLNHVAVALSGGMYIWNATDGTILQLFQEDEEQYVSSVKWIKEGNVLDVGDSIGNVQLWDVANTKIIRTMRGHTGRIATLDWNQHTLASGGREGDIHLHDVRIGDHHVATLSGHSQEVCGLTWSPDGKYLASGGNDNTVQIWDPAVLRPIKSVTDHLSAVKAVSWCPWQTGVLATAGGTVDRTIRIWNTTNMTQINSLDTGSQVSSIVWNTEYKELVSGHGFSQNQLTVWKYPSLAKVADLNGHTSRVLLLVSSPDGSSVASVAADETIRFWNIWPLQAKEKKTLGKGGRSHPFSLLAQSIRRLST